MAMVGMIIAKKYSVLQMIGSGSFGGVYRGIDITDGTQVALKMEPMDNSQQLLKHEYKLYRELEEGEGIPKVLYYCRERGYNVLVMELLGSSLGNLFQLCKSRFTIKTVLMLADKMIERLQYLHSKNLIHCDIKPDNFVMGRTPNNHKLFLIDFGLAKRYRRELKTGSRAHILNRQKSYLIGTPRYASIRAHQGCEMSRRDDMEALGYVMIHLHRGSLPWQRVTGLTKKQKIEKICEIKISTTTEVLCQGLPVEFILYVDYCRTLLFMDEPQYQFLQNLFRSLFHSLDLQYDRMFDWMIQSEVEQDDNKTSPTTSGNI